MALNETLRGLVVELPDHNGIGVVLDATRQGKHLYKATVVCDNGDIMIAQFTNLSLKVGETLDYIDYTFFEVSRVAEYLGSNPDEITL